MERHHCPLLGKDKVLSLPMIFLGFHMIIVGAGLGGFVACRALSQRNSDPTKASRPWDIVINAVPCPLNYSVSFVMV